MRMCRWFAMTSLVAAVFAHTARAQEPRAASDTARAPSASDTTRIPRGGKARDAVAARPELMIPTGESKDRIFIESLGDVGPIVYVTSTPGAFHPIRLPSPTTPGRGVVPGARGFPLGPVAALAGLGALALLASRDGDDDETPPVTVIPEPATIVLMGTGFLLTLGVVSRRHPRVVV